MPYIGVSPQFGVRRKHTYTATAGQTIFTGAGSEGATLSYTDSNFVDVYQNGVKLGDADYTSTSGTQIVLTQAASVDDLVEIIVFDAFSAADTVSKADGGTFDGAITLAGGVSGNTTFSGEIITSTSGTSNTRIGENAGDAIASGGNYNVLIGDEAGTALTTGDNNVAVGFEALKTEDAHGNNVAVGYQALKVQDAGADGKNVAVGYQAGVATSTGSENVFIGASAGDSTTVGIRNVASGAEALYNNIDGSNHVAIGYQALYTQTTDNNNVAIGWQAMALSNGASSTVAIGREALEDATGDNNVAIGYQAGNSISSGSHNTIVGYLAGGANTPSTAMTGGYNAIVGREAGSRITSADECVLIGNVAGDQITTGGYNVFIGSVAGTHNVNVDTGSKNIIIGPFSDLSAADGANQIVMGYDQSCTGDNNFTFGNGSSGADSNIAFGATSITAPSDERLKEDIKDETIGLAFIDELRPVTFRWKKKKDIPEEMYAYDKDSDERCMNGKYNHGFIAQEVKAVMDKYDFKEGTQLWTQDPHYGQRQRLGEGELIPFLVKAIQELSAKVTSLEAEVKALKGE